MFTESQKYMIVALALGDAQAQMMGDRFLPGCGEHRKKIVDDAIAISQAFLPGDADLAEIFQVTLDRVIARRAALVASGAFPSDPQQE